MQKETTDATGAGGNQQQQGSQQKQAPVAFADWFASQDDAVKALIETEIQGLKKALEAERNERKSYERKLREAAKELEEGSAARKAIEAQADKLKALERQAAFYDAAHAKGCTNLRLAFLAAQDAGLVHEDGSTDWEALKAGFPELFTTKTPAGRGHAGEGNDKAQAKPQGMDAFIRAAAGLGPR